MRAWPTRRCYRVFATPLLAIKSESHTFASRGADSSAPERLGRSIDDARRERLLRRLAAAVTVLAATVAVLGAAMTAVVLGIT